MIEFLFQFDAGFIHKNMLSNSLKKDKSIRFSSIGQYFQGIYQGSISFYKRLIINIY